MAYGSPLAQRIYYAAPRFLQELALSYAGRRHRKEWRREHFERWCAHLLERQFEDAETTSARVSGRLQAMVECAYQRSAFYRDRMDRRGVRPSDIRSAADLPLLPLLTKDEVRQNASALATYAAGERVRPAHTSGTTGSALLVWLSDECYQREYAYRSLHYSWAGATLDDRCAVFAGHPVVHVDSLRPPFCRFDRVENRLLFSSQHLRPEFARSYVEELRRFKPEVMHGYPSSVAWVAEAALVLGVSDIRPRGVFTSAETLLPWQRDVIEKAFACRVFNWYGNAEHNGNITQCEAGGLHIQPEHSVLEFVDDNGEPVPPGTPGKLVATTLVNTAMPLIRYVVGDMVTPISAMCGCGRKSKLVASVEGRIEDYVVGRNGQLFGRLDHIFKDAHRVAEAQIVQREPGAVVIRVVPRPGYAAADEQEVLDGAHFRLGSDFRITIELVDRIERSRSGKFQFVLNTLPRKAISAEAALEQAHS